MSQAERLYRIKHLLSDAGGVTKARLLGGLGISRATLTRDLTHLRDRMNMPVVYVRDSDVYRIDPSQTLPGAQYELPGLWFSAEEIHALLTMQHLLANLDAGGLLGPHIAPLTLRLGKLLGQGAPAGAEVVRRIRVQTVGARKVHLPHFQAVGTALLQRRRLAIDYHARGRDQRSQRTVSPQRLIHYRDNWYLDGWCHQRRALRSFSVDAIQRAQVLDQPAIDVPDTELDDVLGAGYGIFAGRAVTWATLRFSPERARWVAAETWHPQQRGRWDGQGCWVLELPYADPRNLVMDILRHVPEVEVMSPPSLSDLVREKLAQALQAMAPLDKRSVASDGAGSFPEPA